MAKEIAPQGTGTVKVPFAMNVCQPATFGVLDDKSIVFGHLRKRMPDRRPVEPMEPL
jgi:hypothetical protein